MKCKDCGQINEESARFCENCGSALKEPIVSEKKPKKSKWKYVIVLAVIVAAVAVGAYIALSGSNEKNYTDKIAMADTYVEKKEYKKAEDAYLEAIEIDPKQEEPYIKLSEVYTVQDKHEEAVKILEKAEKTVSTGEGKKKITEKKKEISNLIEYSWVVKPEIQADDMFYVPLDGLTPDVINNELYKQFTSSYTAIKRGDTYSLINDSGIMADDFLYEHITALGGRNYVLKRTEPKYEKQYKEECDQYYLNGSHIEPLLGVGGIGNDTYYYTDQLHSHREDFKDLKGEIPATAFPIQKGKEPSLESPYAIYKRDKLVTDFIYEECGSASEGLLAVKENGKWGYVNEEGKTIIPCSYDSSWKQYTMNFDTNIKDEKDYAYAASGGYVNLVKDGKWELRNLEGDIVIQTGVFEKILPVVNNKCWVKKDGKWGLISLQENNKTTNAENVNIQGIKREKANCTYKTNESQMIIDMEAENDQIDKIDLKVIIDVDVKNLTEKQKEEVETKVRENLNLIEDPYMKTSLTIEGNNAVVNMNFDIHKCKRENLKNLGISDTSNILLSETVNAAKKNGTSCSIVTE